jgi:DNA polymerase/3'-5' exonuclease PolX
MFQRKDFDNIITLFKNKYYLRPTGSVIRQEDKINDLDFLTYKPLDEILEKINKDFQTQIISNGSKFLHFKLYDFGIEVNIWKMNKDNHLFMKLSHDYDKQLQISMRRIAKKMGYKLNNNGLYDENGALIDVKNIKDIFKKMNVQYRKPEEGHLSRQ